MDVCECSITYFKDGNTHLSVYIFEIKQNFIFKTHLLNLLYKVFRTYKEAKLWNKEDNILGVIL